MKNRLNYIAILAITLIPFAAPWEGAASYKARHAAEGVVFFPVLDTDMSGLDVRDAQNRPVLEASAHQNLRALFLNNLFNLTVVTELHSVRQIWSDLEMYSALFGKLFFNFYHRLKTAVQSAWIPTTKRFVHNVDNVWKTFYVGLFMCLLLSAFTFYKPTQKAIHLRC